MITFNQLGRYGSLGNQMFQIASTIGLSQKYNTNAVFPLWYCKYSKKNMSDYFINKIDQTLNSETISFNYEEPHFHFIKDFKFIQNMNLNGYFQSERYFLECSDLIKHYFEPTPELINRLNVKYGDVSNENICSIHVRRGDYVNNTVYSQTGIDYYNDAIRFIESKYGICKFFIFSDDANYCKMNFTGNKFVFIEGNLDVEDLFLMSMCKHNIIANSTFSWWASWLNKNKHKLIVAPSKWIASSSGIDDSDIYTSNMIVDFSKHELAMPFSVDRRVNN